MRFQLPLFNRQNYKFSFLLLLLFSGLIFTSPAVGLPPLGFHTLPPTLTQWHDQTNSGDYFAQVKSVPVGYLIWSDFPIKIYVEKPSNSIAKLPDENRFQEWVKAVLLAVQEWNIYLPLALVEQPEIADIKILRSRPDLQVSFNRITREFNLPRARSAETRYELYLKKEANNKSILAHKFVIKLSPDQVGNYIIAAARHEIGHALGIWGHSPLETDTMYFSQVRNPPPISARDINTLKLVYQQQTRLGWGMGNGGMGSGKWEVRSGK